ncbi:MAG: alpha/beta fold hydrolase [Bacteriovoracia bacterium]
MPASGKLSIAARRAAYGGAKSVLSAIGFRFEIHRRNVHQIGMWRWRRRGSALPRSPRRLVLIPGLGDSALTWMLTLAPALPSLHGTYDEVVFLEMPGFEGALFDEKPFDSMDDLLATAFDCLERLRPRVICGHSLGGWIASAYSVRPRAKHLPSEVVLLAPSGVGGSRQEKLLWKAKFDRALKGDAEQFKKHVFVREPLVFRLFPNALQDFFARKEIRRFVASIREDHFVEKKLKGFRPRATIVWGDRDTLNPFHWAEYWAKGLGPKKSRVFQLQGVGHNLHLENPLTTLSTLVPLLWGRQGWLRFHPRVLPR